MTEQQVLDSRLKAELCATLLLAKQAQDLSIRHVGPLVGYTDFFLLATGRSSRHVQALADHLQQEMRRLGLKPLGVEGMAEGTWVLLDYNEVIVHIFHEPVRQFYDLDGLWGDATQIEVPESPAPAPGATESAPADEEA